MNTGWTLLEEVPWKFFFLFLFRTIYRSYHMDVNKINVEEGHSRINVQSFWLKVTCLHDVFRNSVWLLFFVATKSMSLLFHIFPILIYAFSTDYLTGNLNLFLSCLKMLKWFLRKSKRKTKNMWQANAKKKKHKKVDFTQHMP